MEIVNKTGAHNTETAKKNLEKIRRFYIKNPGSSKMECKKALGLSYATVLKHTKTILEEK